MDTRTTTTTQTYFTIQQTSATSEAVTHSGQYSSKAEAVAALNTEERAMLGDLVNIVQVVFTREVTTKRQVTIV